MILFNMIIIVLSYWLMIAVKIQLFRFMLKKT